MNWRKRFYFSLVGLRGQPLGKYYEEFVYEYQKGTSPDATQKQLIRLLRHCERNVPYYSKIIKKIGGSYENDPIEYLTKFPVLKREDVRRRFDELKSADMPQRQWYLNSTGGSTGESLQFIQDREYASRAGAISLLLSKLVGSEIGERRVILWGSPRDITCNEESWQGHLILGLTNTTLLNTVLMTRARMLEFIKILNESKPRLIIAFAESIYELAKFAEKEDLIIIPQSAIITSAGKLYPFMREKIEGVFQCKAFDRYGSREVGDIACERPGFDGLWVAPWGNYLEIIDPEENRVPEGNSGEILVTSLSNYAMPLIRYRIGDRGTLLSTTQNLQNYNQALKEVIGRSMDFFKTQDDSLINPGFLMANLYFKNWIARYQIIQKNRLEVVYKFVKAADPPEADIEEIIAITRKAMGYGCKVSFDFVDEIPPTASGKYRFLISEVQ